MSFLDVFNDDAFTIHSLTAAVEKLPYVPARVGALGIFEDEPITTKIAIVEEQNGILRLLPTMPRGQQPSTTQGSVRRTVRAFLVPHIPHNDALLADELEGKRAFGSEDQIETFSTILNDKMERMKQDYAVTWEYHMIGALKGIVLDADGSTEIVDWYDEFGLSAKQIVVNFDDAGTWDDAQPVMDMKLVAQSAKRQIEEALGATPLKRIRALCGAGFFDSFVSHVSVRGAYGRYTDNEFARSLQDEEGGFEFGGITWEYYRGSIGAVPFIANDEARLYPEGTKGIFSRVLAPADYVETVNTRGKELYVKQERMKWDKGVEIAMQSNPLFVCKRPGVLLKLLGTNLTSGPVVS